MSANGDILLKLVEDDFQLEGRGRWYRSKAHSSLVIDREKGIFFFNAKEIVGDPFIYLTKVRGLSLSDARAYLSQFKDYKSTFVYTITNKENEQDTIVFPRLVEVFHEMGNEYGKREYWYDRGISDATIDRYELGWYNGYVTIPIFVDGVFRNFQIRQDKPSKRIRNYYSGVGPLIYNSDVIRLSNTVFIAEGITDCLRLLQEGLPVVSCNVGAGGWQEEWYKYFIKTKDIYVVFDNDKAGFEGMKRVAKNLGMYRTHLYNFSDQDTESYDIVNYFNDGGTKDKFLDLVYTKSKFLFEIL